MLRDKQNSIILIFILIILFGFGLAIRLIDIDDPPLDFNPTRQLRSAIIARGMYYASLTEVEPEIQSLAIRYGQAMERLEPPILESVVVLIYQLIGSETLWVSRIVTSVFWMISAGALYDLGRRMTSPVASLLGVCYFLFLPFSIRASRSFQPDPGMVMLIMTTGWAVYHWDQKRSWKWALITGFLAGLAGLVKPAGLFFVGGMISSVVIYSIISDRQPQVGLKKPGNRLDLQSFLNSQIWVMVVMIILPFLLYFFFGIWTDQSGNLANWTVISRWRDVLNPSFFIRWMNHVDENMNLVMVLAGLFGIFFATGRKRALLIGFWVGYFLFGLVFPYHILTHDYYHLPLVGLVAISLVPLIDVLNNKIIEQGSGLRITYLAILFVFIFYNGWIGRSILLGTDYREHPQFWQEVGNAIPDNSKAIGVTQDYGFRLIYYGWRRIDLWPQGAGIEDFDTITSGADYFVVTAKNKMSDELARYLETNFPVYSRGIGFEIYDLDSFK